jgi:hypothetical protein
MSEDKTAPAAEATAEPVQPVSDAGTETPVVESTPAAAPMDWSDLPAWAHKKYRKLETRDQQRERELQQMRSELELLRVQNGGQEQQPNHASEAQNMSIERIREAVRLEEGMKQIGARGVAEIPTYQQSVQALLENFGADLAGRPDFYEVLMEMPDAHKVVHALGRDPETVSSLLEKTPAQLAASMVRYADKLNTKTVKPVSNAPAPSQPIATTGKTETGYREDMSNEEYFEWRKRQGSKWHR